MKWAEKSGKEQSKIYFTSNQQLKKWKIISQTTLNPRSQGCKMWVTVEPKTATGGQIS